MMPALMQTQNLQAYYGNTRVLHGIDFALEQGGITTILGANGAGKTTALRAISGMVRTEGAISFEGQRIDGRKTEDVARRTIALPFHNNVTEAQVERVVAALERAVASR